MWTEIIEDKFLDEGVTEYRTLIVFKDSYLYLTVGTKDRKVVDYIGLLKNPKGDVDICYFRQYFCDGIPGRTEAGSKSFRGDNPPRLAMGEEDALIYFLEHRYSPTYPELGEQVPSIKESLEHCLDNVKIEELSTR